MDPGLLNRRVMLQIKQSTRDPMGGQVVIWVDRFPVWASDEPLSGRELMAAQQKHAEMTARFRLRYREEITQEWRVVFDGHAYDILEVIDVNLDSHRYLDLLCQTGLRGG